MAVAGPKTYDLLGNSRAHKKELKNLYDAEKSAAKFNPGINPYFVAAGYFAGKEREGGAWDLKYQLKKKDGANYNTNYTVYVPSKEIYQAQDIGNYHYGYVGTVLFSENELLRAGDLVQFLAAAKRGDFSQYADDPRDKTYVKKGYSAGKKGL
nr:polymorphic toxin type 44 domain-containing protein [Sporolactobacillus kofuensis]